MLKLSEVLLVHANDISNFDDLKKTVNKVALMRGELFFNVDIEPPAFLDRPNDWHDQLNIAFECAR